MPDDSREIAVRNAPLVTPLLLSLEVLKREALADPQPGAAHWPIGDVRSALHGTAAALLNTYRCLVIVARGIPEPPAAARSAHVPLEWELKTGVQNALTDQLAPLIETLVELSFVTQEELDRE